MTDHTTSYFMGKDALKLKSNSTGEEASKPNGTAKDALKSNSMGKDAFKSNSTGKDAFKSNSTHGLITSDGP